MIVGGIAVAAHGVVRATADLDLVPQASAENLERLAQALTDLGAEHPIDGALTMVNRHVKLLPQPGEDDAADRLNAYLSRAEQQSR